MKIGNFDLTNDGVSIIAELSANHGTKLKINEALILLKPDKIILFGSYTYGIPNETRYYEREAGKKLLNLQLQYKTKGYKGILEDEYPISEEIHQTTLSLPISYFHTAKDILNVCKFINQFKPFYKEKLKKQGN